MNNASTVAKKLKQQRTASTSSTRSVPHENRNPPSEFEYESSVWARIERMCPVN